MNPEVIFGPMEMIDVALTGQSSGSLDSEIETILKDYHSGNSDQNPGLLLNLFSTTGRYHCEPKELSDVELKQFARGLALSRLAEHIFEAITTNNALAFRRISEAIARVHARASGSGSTFTLSPAKPELLAAIKAAQLSGPFTPSGADIAKTAEDMGYSKRHARRLARKLGTPPEKAGRKPKAP